MPDLEKEFKESFSMIIEYGINAEDWFYDEDRNGPKVS